MMLLVGTIAAQSSAPEGITVGMAWLLFIAALVGCAGLVRLAMWLLEQRLVALETGAKKAAEDNEKQHAEIEQRLRVVESGESLKAIEAQLADFRVEMSGRLGAIEARLPLKRRAP